MPKLKLAFLWHQHQPIYKNPLNDVYEMPWVRFHATKDYYDLAAVLDDFPKIKFNINLVPSLMTQLDDYASGRAKDKIVEMSLAPADSLSSADIAFVLDNFFMANYDTMIAPHPRYAELLEKRGFDCAPDALRRAAQNFRKNDLRDLQVWFNLSWTDPYWRKKDPTVAALFEKGKNFTEEDKAALIKKHLEICAAVVPKHKELQELGRAEISTTPFYHPILPLLCDTAVASVAMPGASLPKNRFRRPEDARAQIKKAVEFYENKFGRRPRGFWPSEGSVSEEVVPIFAEFGVKWIATDEEILFRSLPAARESRNGLYEPYRIESPAGPVDIFFRDHALSDAIGFVYARWDPRVAAADFMKRVKAIKSSMRPSEERVVSVILDGENCWEYYPADGEYFLRELLGGISEDPEIETTTYSDYLEKHPPRKTLAALHPGSWINGNFAIWIGHSEDNTSWDYIYEAREFIDDYARRNQTPEGRALVERAMEYLYAAEGSDWNWWYGGDHGSAQDMLFDAIYRAHLKKIYETLGAAVPDRLNVAIKRKHAAAEILEPMDFLDVKLDGAATNYYEWLGAGFYQTGRAGGSMHQVESVVKAIYFGFNLTNLYVRIDAEAIRTPALAEFEFVLKFSSPAGREARISFDKEYVLKKFTLLTPGATRELTSAAAKKVVEAAVPFESLGTKEGETIDFAVILMKNGNEIERWPYQSSFSFEHPGEKYFTKNWSA